MEQTNSPVDKFRQQFLDDLKKEDIDYVQARSEKVRLNMNSRKKAGENPWSECFFFNDRKPSKNSDRSLVSVASSETARNSQIALAIANGSGISDEEINYCKAALRRESFSKKLPDLSTRPKDLQFLYRNYSEEYSTNREKQSWLYEEIVCNMTDFEESLKDTLKALKPLDKIAVTSDTTIDAATANVIKMIFMMHDFKRSADSVKENLCKVFEKFECYKELEEEIDCNLFKFLAHFFPNYLVPRNTRKRVNLK